MLTILRLTVEERKKWPAGGAPYKTSGWPTIYAFCKGWATLRLYFLGGAEGRPGGQTGCSHRIFQAAEMQENFSPAPGLGDNPERTDRQNRTRKNDWQK